MLRPFVLALAWLVCPAALVPPAALAEAPPLADQLPPEAVATLAEGLRVDELIAVMRLEGLDYGARMATELLSGKGGASWEATVARIYDPQVMRSLFDMAFGRSLGNSGQTVTEIMAFFDTQLGDRILALEVEARRSLLDPAVEEAARVRLEYMIVAEDPRLETLQRFAEVNQLVEGNVSSALNANLALFQGMAEIGTQAEDMTEEQMLADVWAQEPEIRAETEDWLMPYLALAYGPLSDEELAAYLRFCETGAGQALNTAFFAAFDQVFTEISRNLGRAAARQMIGEDI